jgi:hypothetical protein
MPSRRRDAVVAVCAPGARDAADAADRSIDRSIDRSWTTVRDRDANRRARYRRV